MKILVAVSEVAELADEFEITDDSIPKQYLEYDLNEWDDYAVEEAVQLSEAVDDVEVVTVTIGPERSKETIRMALAKGADRAIRIWDDALADASFVDASTKASILAAVAATEEPDLVLTGVQTGDAANAATGVTLADELDFQWAAVVNGLDLNLATGTARVHRELEGGLEEIVDVDLPAVFTIQSGINDPRYASLRGIRQAQGKPLDAQTLADLDLNSSVVVTPVRQTGLAEPDIEGEATVWEGEPNETASELATLLREKGVGQ